jgi:hypothetical protein
VFTPEYWLGAWTPVPADFMVGRGPARLELPIAMTMSSRSRPIAPVTYAKIEELSDGTSLPVIEVIRALFRSGGDVVAAREALLSGDAGRIEVAGRNVAEHLAAMLAGTGLQFACEPAAGDLWQFRMPTECIARARALGYLSRRRARTDDQRGKAPEVRSPRMSRSARK